MLDPKLEKLNKLIELMQNDTVRPQEIEKFLGMVLAFVGQSKNSFEAISADNLSKISEALQTIQIQHSDTLSKIDAKSGQFTAQVESQITKLQKIINDVKAIKATPGKDGNNADEVKIVAEVLAQIPKPEPVILDNGEQIANKLELLKGDERLDFNALKNTPEFPVFKEGKSQGSGLRNVFHDTTLTGTGTVNDPLKVVGGGGSGTVTSVSVVTANGVSGSVATSTTTPAITLTLAAITPTSVNSVVLSGSSTPTLAVTGTTTVSGANTGDQNLFSSIPVSGQTTVTANSPTTALTLVAGSNITITTDNTAKTITFTGTGGGTGDMTKAVYDPANIGQQLIGTTATQTLTNKDFQSLTNKFSFARTFMYMGA